MSSFRLKLPTPELQRSIKVKEKLESSLLLKKLLLGLVLFETAMFISNGVITPAMSVLSAVSGLKVGIPNASQDIVVMISVALFVILYSLQRYATSKIGFAVGPTLLIWFCCIGPTAFKAFNPLYIIYYFGRNPFQAWLSLGGCLLCATGSEAIFSNLCYFPVRYVQSMFVLLVLPCLVLAYLGQAAFLIANQNSSEQMIFSSIPINVGGTDCGSVRVDTYMGRKMIKCDTTHDIIFINTQIKLSEPKWNKRYYNEKSGTRTPRQNEEIIHR